MPAGFLKPGKNGNWPALVTENAVEGRDIAKVERGARGSEKIGELWCAGWYNDVLKKLLGFF